MLRQILALSLLILPVLMQPAAQAQGELKEPLKIASRNEARIDWQTDLQFAMQKAQQENKLIFIDISAEW